MGYARLTIGYGGSGWISVDERDYLQNMILTRGEYEPEVWGSLAAFAVRDEIVWDVGANIGSLAIKALLDPRVSQVHAFEPDPEHAAVLEMNLAMNQGRWSLHRVALDRERETRRLLQATFPHRGGSTLLHHPTHGRFVATAAVECRPADEMIFNAGVPAPTLMKIDVEGWESHVFDGAKRLLSRQPPKAIVFEADSDPRGILVEGRLTTVLEGFGYEVTWLRRPEGTVYHRENYLAVHRASVRPILRTATCARAGDG
jgi:FkbM family methyltransferase